MPDSTESRADASAAEPQTTRFATKVSRYLPRPRTMGFFALFITALAFIAGSLRSELSLFLLGAVFLIVLVYCFLGVFFLGILCCRKAGKLSLTVSPEAVDTGKEAELCVKTDGGEAPGKNYFFRLPAILVRCELRLQTGDGRVIRHNIDPGFENGSFFPVRERGAYFSEPENNQQPLNMNKYRANGRRPGGYNRFVISDIPGFFRLSFPLHSEPAVCLLALPAPAEEPVPLPERAGGSEERYEAHYRKSNDLTDHRPYIPGDDPRRINWKLYGHAPMGELFVREGEPEPPPHSRLLMLVDTEADRLLYTVNEGRCAVDLLCETVLAAALEYSERGTDVLVGYTGGRITEGGGGNAFENITIDAAKFAAANLQTVLARPFAIPLSAAGMPASTLPLPDAPKNIPVIIFALPRIEAAGTSALERFLKKREAGQEVDILFLYDTAAKRAAEIEEAAGICANLYNGRNGVHCGKLAGGKSAGDKIAAFPPERKTEGRAK